MRVLAIAFVLLCLAAPAVAQQSAPAQSPPAAAPTTAQAPAAAQAPAPPKPNRCRAEALKQNLRGQALRDFIQVCRLEARLSCVKEAIAKKIAGAARKDYVKGCES